MKLFNLNKVTNRIVFIVLVVISLIVIAITFLLAYSLTNINIDKEIKSLSHHKLDLYYKTNYIIKSLQNRLRTVSKQTEFNYKRYKQSVISKEIFLENINTNLLLTTPYIEMGYGIGYWFEPYIIDSSRYYGLYSIKLGDSAYITPDYSTPEYDYHNHYWYTNIIPKGWDRKLPLIDTYHWSDIYIDSGYSNQKMITLGIPLYDELKTIVGATTLDLTEDDFASIFAEYLKNQDMTLIFRKKYSKMNIFSNNNEFCVNNVNDINKIIANNQDSISNLKKAVINGDNYLILTSTIENQFVIALIVPTHYLNSIIFSQISIIVGFAILIISLIIFGFVYSYRVIIDHSLTNEHLKNFYQKLIEKSPNNLLIFDKNGKLIEYNEKFKDILDNYNMETFDLEFFIKNIVAYKDKFILEQIDCKIFNNYKFYLEQHQYHYLLNCFIIEDELQKSYVFILTNISELIEREIEIKNLNKNLEKIIANRTEQLEGAMSSLQNLNKKLSKNMENLSKANNDLSKSERNLMNTITTKDKFFSVITHDIKNPLHSIKLIIELLKNYFNMMKEDEIKSYYNKVSKTIDSVNNLIENVLLWSKSQSNLINFEPEIFDLSQSISNTIKLLDSAALQKNISIKLPDTEEIIVKTDKNMFEVIFRNILSNSIKFSNKNSSINVTISDDAIKNKLLVTIQDFGIGMDPQTLDVIFENQGKTPKSGTDGEKGTGIGLSLTKNFIDLMNEKIWVESTIDIGTKFSFTVNKLL